MKRYLILLAVTLTGTMAKAESYALKVNLYGNTSATYVLDTKPVVTYGEDNVTIKSLSMEATYLIDEVESFTFVEDTSSGVETVTQTVTYVFRDNIFTCEGHSIRVFSLSGAAVASGIGSVSLEALDRGIYIVNTGDRSVRIVKQ